MFNGGVTFFNLRCWLVVVCLYFLADRTSSRAYATVLRLSVVCNVCIVAKRCVLPKNCLKKQIEKGLGVIEWSRDVISHVTIRFPSRKITKKSQSTLCIMSFTCYACFYRAAQKSKLQIFAHIFA